MTYLNIDDTELTRLGAIHTAREICQQPNVWGQVWEKVCARKESVEIFLRTALAQSKRIVLTGAGTSAYIGLSLKGLWQRSTGIIAEAIASTDIVTHPEDFFHRDIPTLLISFARSGNSPESTAVLKLADEYCPLCYHLIITCNKDGELANYNTSCEKFVFVLPNEANDLSLAMTSSYSGMLLAGVLMARIGEADADKEVVARIAGYGERIIGEFAPIVKKICDSDFNRAFFLGSGSFYGTATESHLKLQELTDGKVICKSDSYLGFRHGPKAVVDEHTLIVYFLSGNKFAALYEKDLIESDRGTRPMLEMAVAEGNITGVDKKLGYSFRLDVTGRWRTDDEYLAVCYILLGQLLGFYKSLRLGLRPDEPSASGAITRVVEGVNIY
ncbi:MAG: hypothetical protein BGO55_04580 [Sphingobacteriales bacterium 50-39]|nr:SIS domain-containing protein [Sphingobacteriales bacterium]OJW55897.1 MAG: hypothetical protein BGO55_04580 [Sphingobacteriales bacterium 50-39]